MRLRWPFRRQSKRDTGSVSAPGPVASPSSRAQTVMDLLAVTFEGGEFHFATEPVPVAEFFKALQEGGRGTLAGSSDFSPRGTLRTPPRPARAHPQMDRPQAFGSSDSLDRCGYPSLPPQNWQAFITGVRRYLESTGGPWRAALARCTAVRHLFQDRHLAGYEFFHPAVWTVAATAPMQSRSPRFADPSGFRRQVETLAKFGRPADA